MVLPRPMISDHGAGPKRDKADIGRLFVMGFSSSLLIGLISGVSSFRYISSNQAPLAQALLTPGKRTCRSHLFRLSPMKIRGIVQGSKVRTDTERAGHKARHKVAIEHGRITVFVGLFLSKLLVTRTISCAKQQLSFCAP